MKIKNDTISPGIHVFWNLSGLFGCGVYCVLNQKSFYEQENQLYVLIA